MSQNNNFDNHNNPINGIFKGLEKVIYAIGDMVDKNENIITQSGEISSSVNDKIKGAYNFSVRMGINEHVKSLKDISAAKTHKTKVEPETDIFNEDTEITVIIMASNIEEKDIQIEAIENIVSFEAQNPNIHYHKKISLPPGLNTINLKWSYKNGIIKIDIPKGE